MSDYRASTRISSTSEPVMQHLAGDASRAVALWKLEPSELTEIRLPAFPKP